MRFTLPQGIANNMQDSVRSKSYLLTVNFFCTNLILRSFLKLSYCAVHQKTIIFFLFCLGLIDKGFLMGYLLYLASFLCLPVWGLLEDDIPPISSVVVTMEQVSVRNSDFNYSIQEQRAKVLD